MPLPRNRLSVRSEEGESHSAGKILWRVFVLFDNYVGVKGLKKSKFVFKKIMHVCSLELEPNGPN